MVENILPAVRGVVAPGFEPVKDVFASLYSRGWEVGSSFSAFVGDKLVANLYGGDLNLDRTDSPYNKNTLQVVGGCSMFSEALGIALLVDRGYITYDSKISDVWPEFGKWGKHHITLRQLMTHRAGLAAPPVKLTDALLFNKEKMASFLAEQSPEWPVIDETTDSSIPFSAQAQGFHYIMRGLYTSEICHRVDPKRRYLSEFLQEEICEPLGIEFFIKLPEKFENRLSPINELPGDSEIFGLLLGNDNVKLPQGVYEPDPKDARFQLTEGEKKYYSHVLFVRKSLAHRSTMILQFDDVPPKEIRTHRKTRMCDLPSSSGVSNSYSLAALATLLANNGSFNNKTIFSSSSAIQTALKSFAAYEPDKILQSEVPFTQGGFGVCKVKTDDGPNDINTYGWGGAAGSMVRSVPSLKLGCSYVTNLMGFNLPNQDPRGNFLLSATLACVKKYLNKVPL